MFKNYTEVKKQNKAQAVIIAEAGSEAKVALNIYKSSKDFEEFFNAIELIQFYLDDTNAWGDDFAKLQEKYKNLGNEEDLFSVADLFDVIRIPDKNDVITLQNGDYRSAKKMMINFNDYQALIIIDKFGILK